MIRTTREALQQTTLAGDDELYRLVRFPAGAVTVAAGIVAEVGSPFCAMLVDRYEVTLIVPEDAVEEFASRLQGTTMESARYRLITFDVVLPPDLVGFMAAVSAAVARAGVSILPFGAYSRDHILVRASQYDDAIAALKSLIENA